MNAYLYMYVDCTHISTELYCTLTSTNAICICICISHSESDPFLDEDRQREIQRSAQEQAPSGKKKELVCVHVCV